VLFLVIWRARRHLIFGCFLLAGLLMVSSRGGAAGDAQQLPIFTAEAAPSGTPAGLRAFRLRDPVWVYTGLIIKSIVFDNGRLTYESAPGCKYSARRQSSTNPVDSHVLLLPAVRIPIVLMNKRDTTK
jgi:hypothetical protein